MTHVMCDRLAVGAMALLVGCSREVTPPPAPEGPAPALTPAARPLTPPPSKPRCLEHFALFDRDGDARVSREEFEAHPHPHANPAVVFQLRDKDGDGFLSDAEFCSDQATAPGMMHGRRTQIGAGR